MRCQQIQELLSAYLDGELPPSPGKQIDEHLRSCAACRARWEELRETVELVRALPELAPPPDWRKQLTQKLASLPAPLETAPAGQEVRSRNIVSRLKLIPAAAVFILVLGSICFYLADNSRVGLSGTAGGKKHVQVAGRWSAGSLPSESAEATRGASPDGASGGPGKTPGTNAVSAREPQNGRNGVTVSGRGAGEQNAESAYRPSDGTPEKQAAPLMAPIRPFADNGTGSRGKGGDSAFPTAGADGSGTTAGGAESRAVYGIAVPPDGVAGTLSSAAAGDAAGAAKTIRRAEVTLQTGDPEQAVKNIAMLVERYHGNTGSASSGKMISVELPAGSLQPFLSDLGTLGRVLGENVEEDDITKEYSATADRLSALQKQAAGKSGMQTAGSEKLPDEIKELKDRLQGFDEAVSRATVNITLK